MEWNEEASHLLSYSNQVIYLPMLNKRQLHRATYLNINTPASSAEEYLKNVISIPLLDHLIMDMKERINKDILYIHTNLIYFLSKNKYIEVFLIPKVMNENKYSWKENILNFDELVKVDLPKLHLIKTELIFWEVKWTETKDISNTVINTLKNMSR